MRLQSVLMAGAVTSLATVAGAATISTSASVPSGTFIASQPNANVTNSDSFRTRTNNGGDGRDLGQMFTTGASNLQMDSFTLRLASNSGNIANRSVTVRLVQITSDSGGNNFTFSQNLSETANLPGTFTNGEYMTFDIADTLLQANTTYAFIVGLTTVAVENAELGFNRNDVTAPAGNRFFETFFVSGTSRTSLALSRTGDRELQFWVNAVPEPASIGLLALGGLLCVRRSRA